MYNAIGLTKASKMLKTAEGLVLLLNILCLIENNALLALRLKVFSAVMNLPLEETFIPKYLY